MPKISKPLTTTEIKNIKPKDKQYKKPDGRGLWLVVRPTVGKYWRYDFKYGGKNLSMSFGVYPGVGLKEAREKRESARELLSKNINPISEKRIKKAAESLTLQNVIDKWIDLRKKSSSTATITQNKRILKNITDWLGNIAIKDIKRVDIINALEKLQSRGVIETAHRLLSLINKIYMFAVTKEYIEHNIIADIDKKSVLIPNQKDTHLAAITEPKDIKQLLLDINLIGEKLKSDIITIFIFKLIPYVFVRSENIRLMCWDDINLEKGVWEIPKEKMKMKVDFVCPLPKQAIDILKQIEPFSRHRSRFVFPSPYKNDRGVSGATLSGYIK
ncbi:MAG: tyrosine-type recombinase/integrase [Campylobacterota bacterium]